VLYVLLFGQTGGFYALSPSALCPDIKQLVCEFEKQSRKERLLRWNPVEGPAHEEDWHILYFMIQAPWHPSCTGFHGRGQVGGKITSLCNERCENEEL